MGRMRFVSPTAGSLGILCYLAFAVLAFHKYPAAYSPATNWLSDLGSAAQNPRGAVFYNTAVILAGFFGLLFFLGLYRLRIAGKRRQCIMLFVSQGLGVLGSFSLIMSGLYPADLLAAHVFWSTSLYVMLGAAFAFSIPALSYHASCPRWLLGAGVLVVAVDIVSIVFGRQVMEWITVALILFYVGAVAAGTRRL